jgi:hypothetical protein
MNPGTERVILVHGTGATAPSEDGGSWWQTRHPLWRRLGAMSDERLRVEAFIWSGANSETARRSAGKRLYLRLRQIDAAGESVHLLGHSHGGSVIWHALQLFNRRRGRFERAIRSWASVGTPFLQYGARRARLWLLLGVLAMCSAALWASVLSLRRVELAYVWRDDPLTSAAWGALALLPALIALWSAGAVAPFVWSRLGRRGAHGALTAELGKRKYLCLWSSQDEPIIGLGAAGSFSLKVLREGGGGAAYLVYEKLFSPIKIAVNQFVNNLVSRAIQGSSVSHVELRATTNYPHPALCHCPLPAAIDGALIEAANAHSGQLGQRVRELLVSGADPVTGFADLQRAAGRAMTFRELVHTSYFDNAACIGLLLQHVAVHSAVVLDVAVDTAAGEFYDRRHAEAPAGAAAARSLPSNQLGYAVALAALGLAALLAVLQFSQAIAHRQALAPSTPDLYFNAALGAPKLSMALASTYAGGMLDKEVEASRAPRNLLRIVPADEVDAAESPADPFQSTILRPYLKNFLRAGQLAGVLRAAGALETVQLKELFRAKAWPILLELADDKQLDVLLTPSAVFPGERRRLEAPDGIDDEYYPAIGQAIGKLAARSKLNAHTYQKIEAACAAASLCRRRVRLEAAYALLNAAAEADIGYLLPLPAPTFDATRRVGKFSLTEPRVLLQDLELVPRGGTDKLLRWLAAHGHWEHLGRLLLLGNTRSVDSAAIAPLAQAAAAALDGTAADWLLYFMLKAPWDAAPSMEFVGQLEALAARRLMAGSAHRHQRPAHEPNNLAGGTVKRQIARFRKDAECVLQRQAEPAEPAEPAGDGAVATDGAEAAAVVAKASCREGRRERSAARQAAFLTDSLEALAEARKATVFNGDNGLLSLLPTRRSARNPPEHRAMWLAVLFDAMVKATCSASDASSEYYTDLSADELDSLKAAFAVFDPAPAALSTELERWRELVNDPFKACPGLVQADQDARAEFKTRWQQFTLLVAAWLHPAHADVALAMMQITGGTSQWVGDAGLHGELENDYTEWFLARDYPVDTLLVSIHHPSSYRLQRRAAYYRIAACEAATGRPDRAAQAEVLALYSGYDATAFSRPKELARSLEAEALYRAVKHDWRGPDQTCARCDSNTRLAMTVGLIPFLAAAIQGAAPPPLMCNVLSDSEYKEFIGRQRNVDLKDRPGAATAR